MSRKILMLLKNPRCMMLFTLGATFTFWVLDAAIDYLVHYDEEFLEILFPTGKELWFRVFFSICMLSFGSAISYLVKLNNRTEQRLEESRKLYKDLVEFTSAVHWEIDPASMTFIYVSPQLENLLGYPLSHWTDLNFLYLVTHPDDASRARTFFSADVLGQRDSQLLLRLMSRDGQVVWMRFHFNVRKDGCGQKRIRGISMNVTDSKQAEESLLATLREKDVLVKEVNHRVRNNMSVIMAILNLQLGGITDTHTRSIFKKSCNRIRTMSMVHDALYMNNDLMSVNVEQFFRDLVIKLCEMYGISTSDLKFDVRSSVSCLGPENLMLCGMIVNELATNSLIHSVKCSACRELTIELVAEGDMKSLRVGDAGQCMDDWIERSERFREMIGFRLVRALVDQMGGVLELTGRKNAQVTVRFK